MIKNEDEYIYYVEYVDHEEDGFQFLVPKVSQCSYREFINSYGKGAIEDKDYATFLNVHYCESLEDLNKELTSFVKFQWDFEWTSRGRKK